MDFTVGYTITLKVFFVGYRVVSMIMLGKVSRFDGPTTSLQCIYLSAHEVPMESLPNNGKFEFDIY